MPSRTSSCQTEHVQLVEAETQAPDRLSKDVDAILETEVENDVLRELAELVDDEQLHQLCSATACPPFGMI